MNDAEWQEWRMFNSSTTDTTEEPSITLEAIATELNRRWAASKITSWNKKKREWTFELDGDKVRFGSVSIRIIGEELALHKHRPGAMEWNLLANPSLAPPLRHQSTHRRIHLGDPRIFDQVFAALESLMPQTSTKRRP